MGTLTGKVAMITGSGGEGGFGRAIARRFAAEGADLVLTDIAPTGTKVVWTKPATGWARLEAVADEVRAAGAARSPHRGRALGDHDRPRDQAGLWRLSDASTSWSPTPRRPRARTARR
jgi:NAD(P)-dependent dehydrogenase (short-subunit alcohol dehydrogenase family)